MSANEKLIQIGLRAREMRKRKQMSLDELATRAELSKSHVSRFERGEKSLSMAAMLRMTEALDMSVAALLGEDQSVDDIHLSRKAERTRLQMDAEDGNVVMHSINGSMPGRPDYAAFVVECPAGIEHSSEAFHSGVEAIFVLSGSIRVTLSGREVQIETGDFLEFPGHIRHTLFAQDGDAELLLFILNY